MIGGPGTAIMATVQWQPEVYVAVPAIALAFGLTLTLLAYAIGPISGCHVNPAVTIGMFFAGKLESAKVGIYLAAQVLGAAAGGLILFLILSGTEEAASKVREAGFAADGYGAKLGFLDLKSVAIAEIVLTAVFVFAVVCTTRKGFTAGVGPIAAGTALTLVHLVLIPIDNASVNPARSIGAALFADRDPSALAQVWAFILFPLVGGALAGLLFKALGEDPVEDSVEV